MFDLLFINRFCFKECAVEGNKEKRFESWRGLTFWGKVRRVVIYYLIGSFLVMLLVPDREKEVDQILNKKLGEIHEVSKADKLEVISKVLERNKLEEKYKTGLYNFWSQMSYEKAADLKAGDVLNWGINEIITNGHLGKYYDLEEVEKQFDLWDGSHRALTDNIKSYLNDPSSYEHIETKYRFVLHTKKESPFIALTTLFTAKNGFGGRVKAMATAKADLESGEIRDFQITN